MPDWAMPPGLPSTWSSADCEQHIRALAYQGVAIEWTDHWEFRERDITTKEALRVLRNGTIAGVAPAQPGFSGVQCRIQFVLPDEGLTTVVVGLSDNNHSPSPYLSIITAF